MLFFATTKKYKLLQKLICPGRLYPPIEYKYFAIEFNYQHNLIKENYTSNLYGKYLSMLVLVIKLSFISLHLRVKSSQLVPSQDFLQRSYIFYY